MLLIKRLLFVLAITSSVFSEAYNSKNKNINPLDVKVRKLNSKKFKACTQTSPVINNLFDISCSYKNNKAQYTITITNVSSENGSIVDTEGSKLFYTDNNSSFKSQSNSQLHWEQNSNRDRIPNTKRKKSYYTDSNTNFRPKNSNQIHWSQPSENNQ